MTDKRLTGWIAWFTYNPVAANLLMVGVLLVGLVTAMSIRTEGFPAAAPRTITVSVGFNGASPRDVEEGAAIKVEQALSGVAGIQKITTTVSESAAHISIRSKDGYPLARLKEDVQARVRAISSFPAQVTGTTVTAEREDRHVIYVQVSGDTDHRTLKEAAKRIRQELITVPTISRVTTEGAENYEISVELSETKLRAYGVSAAEIARAIQGQSVNLSAGTLQTDSGTFTLQSRNQVYFGRDLEQTIVRSSPDGGVVRLGDVARVKDGFAESTLISLYNGQPSIRLGVQLTGKDSITAASDSVIAAVEKVRDAGWLPATITLSTWSDEAQVIRDRLALMSKNAVVGMALVFVMLALFLNPKVAFWVAVGIPISFAGALYVIGPTGFDYSLNDLTTFAFIIVLGIVVDDAIVIGENIYSHQEMHGGGADTAILGAKEVATPATFGVLTTVAAFLPLTMISSDFGGEFKIIAIVVIVCLLFSLVESKLILPAHLAYVKVGNASEGNAPMRFLGRVRGAADVALAWFIARLYQPVLHAAINNLFASLLICLAILVGSLGLVTRGIVPTVFFPGGESTLVYAEVALESGVPAEQTRTVSAQFNRSLQATAQQYQDRYGLAEAPVRNSYLASSNPELLVMTVELAGGTDRAYSAAAFAADWRANTEYSAAIKQVDFYTGFNDIRDLEIEVSADDPNLAEQAMVALKATLANIAGVNDIKTNLDNSVTELTFDVLPMGERLGITNRSLITQLRQSIYGFEAQKVQRGAEEVSLLIRAPREDRNSLADLDRIFVTTPQAGTVVLTDVADIHSRQAQQEFTRIGGQRILNLFAKVDRAVTTPDQILKHLNADVFPQLRRDYPGLRITLAGEAEQETQATSQLTIGFGLALLMIFALLAIPLKSYLLPIVIMCAIPFGIVGAIWGHMLIGIPMSLLSFFGILALSGVVVNDALVLTSRYVHLREKGQDFRQAILIAAPSRFRAILLTSVTTFAGLAPLVWETSEQAQILIPMAVSLAFGLLFATVVTLLIVPVMLGISEWAQMMLGRRPYALPGDHAGS